MELAVRLAVLLATISLVSSGNYDWLKDYETLDEAFMKEIEAGDEFDMFDWELCKVLGETNGGNVVVSPVSVKLLLTMLYEGTRGETKKELETLLRYEGDRKVVRKRFATILHSLQEKSNNFTLDIGEKVYIDRSFRVRPRYRRALQKHYATDIEKVDFSKTKETTDQINQWVERMTEGHIHDMISQDAEVDQWVLLLLNAIYFKGKWEFPFSANDTKVKSFYVNATRTVEVPTMRVKAVLMVTESDEMDSDLIRLPYVGDKYAMYIVLPREKDGLPKLLSLVNPSEIRKARGKMEMEEVTLTLPKFQLKFKSELTPVLQKMGLNQIFTPAANLTGISRNTSLMVSNILQKAGLIVDEEGSTAFVSTTIEVVPMMGAEPFEFQVKHPFLFFIMNEHTNTVLFVGKLVDPSDTHAAKNV